MGLFEDIKAAEVIESRELKALKGRFTMLEKEYQSALDKIEELTRQITAMEDSSREERISLQKEIAILKGDFSTAMESLSHEKHAKAAIIRNRNFYKREFEAVGMLYHLTQEELDEIKSKRIAPKPVVVKKEAEQLEIFPASEVPIAAAIGK